MSGSSSRRQVSVCVNACADRLFDTLLAELPKLITPSSLSDALGRWDESLRTNPQIEMPSAGAFMEAFDDLLDHACADRRPLGSYFTPKSLVEPILDYALRDLVMDRIGDDFRRRGRPFSPLPAISDWTAKDRLNAEAIILDLRIADLAAGPGTFLIPAGEWLAGSLASIRTAEISPSGSVVCECFRELALRSLYGVDLDPVAVHAGRLATWLSVGDREWSSKDLCHWVTADSLAVTEQEAWRDWFPDVFDRDTPGFDVILGNPPFANAIEKRAGDGMDGAKKTRQAQFPDLTGTADLAYYFLAMADRLCRPAGSIGMVLPRAVLAAASTRKLRRRLTETRPPTMIYAPPESLLFRGANVFVACLVLRAGAVCVASRSPAVRESSIRFDPVTIADENWWGGVNGTALDDGFRGSKTVGEVFEIVGSMTTGMAYDLAPFVREESAVDNRSEDEPPLRLVTTGLIDPGVCHWGRRPCRYLKRDYDRPVIESNEGMPTSMQARLSMARRPKVLVAGLSTRIEAYFDQAGAHAGAVSTYSIFHPKDDIGRLRRLSDQLNSDAVTKRFEHELGATALGGGRITVTKDFLRRLPIVGS